MRDSRSRTNGFSDSCRLARCRNWRASSFRSKRWRHSAASRSDATCSRRDHTCKQIQCLDQPVLPELRPAHGVNYAYVLWPLLQHLLQNHIGLCPLFLSNSNTRAIEAHSPVARVYVKEVLDILVGEGVISTVIECDGCCL